MKKGVIGEAIILFGLPMLKIIGYFLMVYAIYIIISKWWF